MEEKRNQLDRNVKLLNWELSIAKEVAAKKAVCVSPFSDYFSMN